MTITISREQFRKAVHAADAALEERGLDDAIDPRIVVDVIYTAVIALGITVTE